MITTAWPPPDDPPSYRAYHINSAGRIEAATVLDVSCDEDAIVATRQLVDGHAMECWERGRFIIRLEPERH